jgi:choline dehydrogenase-like flavoprotein
LDYDVLVVGAGAGGAAAAWYLSKLGLKVACIERGRWQDTTKYPSTGLDWEYRKSTDYSYNPNIRNLPEDYSIDCSESEITLANFNGVGGSTILFSGHFLRFHPSNFKTKSLEGVGEDWPITYEELEPYYNLNDKMMSVSGLSGDPAYPPIDNMLPPIPIGRYGESIAQGFNALSWHWWPSYAAIATRARGGQNACINLGPCNTGCPQGAKSSVDITYISEAVRQGLTVYDKTTVTDILVKNGKVLGVVALRENKESITLKAKVVFLACNAVGTARLLLASKQNGYEHGLGNSHHLVGKFLMLHPLGYVEGLFDEPTDMDAGPQGCCIFSHQFYEPHHKHAFKGGYTLHVLRGGGAMQTACSGLDRQELKWGKDFLKGLKSLYNRRAVISIICEDLPEISNQVLLDNTLIDKDGLPVVKIKYQLGANTKSMMSHGITQAKTVLKKVGLKKILGFGPVPDAGWHQLGTARMGESPIHSVTSTIGEVHDVQGLFIADGSLFPTSAGVNPASTIQALALYIAEKASKKYLIGA